MHDNGHPRDVDISKTLTEHYENVEMEEPYRRKLLSDMLSAASRRQHSVPTARWLYGAAVAASLALVVYLGLTTHMIAAREHRDRLFAVTELRSPVTDSSGHKLKAGDYVASGEVVRTGRGGRVTLVARQGSLIHLDESSELVVDAKGNATVSRGRLFCSNRMHEIKKIETPAGSIRLLGTVLDASVIKQDTAAVTVVEGKVQLVNSHGRKIVSAGNRAMMAASQAPEDGRRVDTAAETAWYDGRNSIVSDADEIAYTVRRCKGVPRKQRHVTTELWVMESDGSNKRLVTTLGGSFSSELGSWWPGSQWLLLKCDSPLNLADPNRPAVPNVIRLVNVSTGQDEHLPLPPDFNPDSASVSPDGKQVAIGGAYEGNWYYEGCTTSAPHRAEGCILIYNAQSREIKPLLSDRNGPVVWSPDGRWLALCEWRGNYTPWYITLVDTRTGETRQIARGREPVFSPDGTRLAYCEQVFTPESAGLGPVCVIDTSGSGEPMRLTPVELGCQLPTWSPDGSEIAFVSYDKERHERPSVLHVAQADGSGIRDVYAVKWVDSVAWGRTGEAIFIRTGEGMIKVAADGSGLIADLGGDEKDSVPPPDVREQLAQARSVIAKAIFEIDEAGWRVAQGRLHEARSILRKAASNISAVPWAYPLARVSVPDVTARADSAYQLAAASDLKLLSIACRQRMDFAEMGLQWFCGGKTKLPPDIQTLEKSGCIGMSYGQIPDPRVDCLKCPGKGRSRPVPFIYTPPKDGVPKIGDVIFQCPNHPEDRVVWNRFLETLRNRPSIRK